MYLAPDPPGCGYREALTRTWRQPKGKTNMSAKALAACSFEPAAEQTGATGHQAPESTAAEIQFREDLRREYRLEAINAGFSAAQATAYATALSSAMGPVGGVSEVSPVERGWFYQSRPGVARRTITSGLTRLTQREKGKTTGRTAVAGPSRLAREFRWWNAGGKS
jgi:hypothetical protein